METTRRTEELFSRLMSAEAEQQPSDAAPPEELLMELPPWYDDRLYKRGQNFYSRNCYTLTASMLYGLVAVFAIPSIIRVLVGTRRSNSPFTAYRRYLSTLLHTVSWLEHDLRPGTLAWNSLKTVRTRHIKASMGAKAKGTGLVSQRDISLTLFGFIGFSILKPDTFGLRQEYDDDWEGYNHFWRVIAHMIGLKEEFSVARETIDETREVCQLVLERVFTPCMENVPEYFEHSARVMVDGLWTANPSFDVESHLWWSRYLSDVPGYLYSEKDRILLQSKIKRQLGGKPLNTGVETTQLIQKTTVKGSPDLPPRKLYYNDYNTLENAPEYKRLTFKSKITIYLRYLSMALYTTTIGRWYLNMVLKSTLFLLRYFPYLAFYRFGFKLSFVNIFKEDLKDDTKPILNSDYYLNDSIKERS